MMNTTFSIIILFEYLGTFAFAVSGAMLAIKKRIDLFGVLFIGITTALGGGVLRDVLTERLPPAMFTQRVYVLIALLASFVTFFVAFYFKRDTVFDHEFLQRSINLFDALGLGVFTVSGVNVVLEGPNSANFLFAIFIGMTTGVGGGMLRDIMLMEIPFVLRKEIYAVASLTGGAIYYFMYTNSVSPSLSILVCISIVFLIRMLAIFGRWKLPTAY